MTNASGPATPAGWYPDPAGSEHLRWWDGAAWTAHLAPRPVPTPAPEPVQQQYVATPRDSYQSGGYPQSETFRVTMEDATPTRSSTFWVWLIVFMPLGWLIIFVILAVILNSTLQADFQSILASEGHVDRTQAAQLVAPILFVYLIPFVIGAVFYIVGALFDRRALLRWGFLKPASAWWILLFTPLVYLIVRTVRIRAEARGGRAPLVTHLVLLGVAVVIIALTAIAIPVFIGEQQETAAIKAEVGNELTTVTKHSFQLDCPDQMELLLGRHYYCSAVDDTTHVSHLVTFEVVTGANGAPVIKLDTATPSLTH